MGHRGQANREGRRRDGLLVTGESRGPRCDGPPGDGGAEAVGAVGRLRAGGARKSSARWNAR